MLLRFFIACALLWSSPALHVLAADTLPPDFFKTKIAPALTRCVGCHGADEPAGELNLTERATALKGGEHGPSFEPGKAADSLLYKQTSDGTMPPKKKGLLQKAELDALKLWLDAGAPWDERDGKLEAEIAADKPAPRAGKNWWSLQPIKRAPIPAVSQKSWAVDPIDAFVLAELDKRKLRPAPPASRATLIRRATFDLLGLPPAPEEIDAFVKDDSPNAYEKLVDRLLASPHYGERAGRHWLDAARFCESDGFEFDRYREHLWPYRDYVVRSFNADMPYAQFVREQIAGDVRDHATRNSIIATAFLTCGPWDEVGQKQASKIMGARVREDDLEDVISAVSQTFLGMTVNCARCHNHKFDPIPQKDYYRIKARLRSGPSRRPRPASSPAEMAAAEKERAARNQKLSELGKRIVDIERAAATIVAAKRGEKNAAPSGVSAGVPTPVARWSFTLDARNEISGAGSVLVGNASISDGQLHLEDHGSFLRSAPLTRAIKEKNAGGLGACRRFETGGRGSPDARKYRAGYF